MTQATGFNAQLLMDFETEFGQTPATIAAVKLPLNSAGLKATRNVIETNTITGRRDAPAPLWGKVDVSGTVVVPVDQEAIGYWLKAMFGDPATTPPATGQTVYTHVFRPGLAQPSLLLEQGFTDIGVYELFNGCKINKFAVTCGGDAELTASIDVLGAGEKIQTASCCSAPATVNWARYNQFQASVTEGGAAIGSVTEASLEIEFGLSGDNYALGGNGLRTALPEGALKVSGKIKAFFENENLLDKAVNHSETSLRFKLTDNNNSLEFVMPEVVYESNAPGIEGSKGIMIELPYRAYWQDSTEDSSIQVVLCNTKTSY
jgi:hypothetical protein